MVLRLRVFGILYLLIYVDNFLNLVSKHIFELILIGIVLCIFVHCFLSLIVYVFDFCKRIENKTIDYLYYYLMVNMVHVLLTC